MGTFYNTGYTGSTPISDYYVNPGDVDYTYVWDPINPAYASGTSITNLMQGNYGVYTMNTIGSPTYNANGTYRLNGSTQYLTLSSALTNGWGQITYSIWFNTFTTGAVTQALIGEWSGGASFANYLSSGGNLSVYHNTTNSANNTLYSIGWNYGISTVTPNTWHELCVTYGGDNGRNVFIDGQLVQANTSAKGIVNNLASAYTFKVGAAGTASDATILYYFNGMIGPFRLINRELTSLQVEKMFNSYRGRFNV